MLLGKLGMTIGVQRFAQRRLSFVPSLTQYKFCFAHLHLRIPSFLCFILMVLFVNFVPVCCIEKESESLVATISVVHQIPSF